jgi:glycosyl-4,4'-diaponeurosporenoate acyltransferase
MRLVHLPTLWTIILDIIAWLIIHIAVVAVMVRLSRSRFNPDGAVCRSRFWEKGGRFYERFVRIRSWKRHVPDGAGWTGDRGFPKKRLQERSVGYMQDFLTETCRAELTHWVILFFAPLFFLWNKFWVGWIMIAYALAENLPLIMVQRYNRQRFRRILERKGPPP